jgi:heptosyltransferase-2
MSERILVVAPSWVGDAILSEPLLALLRERYADAAIDVLAPSWCGTVYQRMRGVRRVIANPVGHGVLGLGARRALARSLRAAPAAERYTRAYVLPNSWKSALVPWLARIPQRIGYVGESRWGLLTDARRLGRHAPARLVDRFAALAVDAKGALPPVPAPVLAPDIGNRALASQSLALDAVRPVAALCPGAEYGPAKRWPAEHFAALAARFVEDGMQVWLIGSPNDRAAAADVVAAAGGASASVRDLTGRTDLGTAIDLLSLASVVVSNDSGLMHAAAAVGAPLVALFGSSSPQFTPPLSPGARIARIEIACSPCFKRECPLGHFRCMRELAPDAVYHLARSGVVATPRTRATPRT